MNRILSNIGTFIKANQTQILTGVSITASVAAVGFACYESDKAKTRLRSNKESILDLKEKHKNGEISDEEYRKRLAKTLTKTAGNAAYDMKGTLICEAIAVGAGIASCALGVKAYRGAAALASTALAYSAFLEEGIRESYGDDALKELKKPRCIHRKVEVKNPETGKVETKEYELPPPDLEGIDSRAYELCKKLGYPYSIGTILIDDRFSIYKSVGGEVDNVLYNLRIAQAEANERMWTSKTCRNTIMDTLECLGLYSNNNDTIDVGLANMIGTVNAPMAYDMNSKSWVQVPGFTEDGKVVGSYGETMNKCLSFGTEIDKAIADYIPYDGIDVDRCFSYQVITDPATNKPYFLLDLSYDGNIANLHTGKPSPERIRSAWIEHPEMEK